MHKGRHFVGPLCACRNVDMTQSRAYDDLVTPVNAAVKTVVLSFSRAVNRADRNCGLRKLGKNWK